MVSYSQIASANQLQRLQREMLQEDSVLQDIVADKVEKRAEHKAILKSDHAYIDPTEDKIYVGEVSLPSGYRLQTFKYPVRDLKLYKELSALGKIKSSYLDRAKYDSFEPEFQEDYKIYDQMLKKIGKGEMSFKNARIMAAAEMHMADFQGMRLIDILGTVQNLQQRTYSLQGAGTQSNINQLLFRIPLANRFQIGTELDEHETVEAMQMSFSAEIYALKKDMAHIAWSDEFELAGSFDFPIMPMTMANAVSDFERVKAAKVASQVLGASSGNATDKWNAFETAPSDRSKRNPAYDFQVARTAIDQNGGVMDQGATSSLTYLVYLANTYVNGQIQPSEGTVPYTGVVGTPRQGGLTTFIDRNVPDGVWALWASNALYVVQSIVKTSTYREEHIGGNGVYIRNWNGAFLIDPERGYVIKVIL